MFKVRKAERKAGFIKNPPSSSSTVPAEPSAPAAEVKNQPPTEEPKTMNPTTTTPISDARLERGAVDMLCKSTAKPVHFSNSF